MNKIILNHPRLAISLALGCLVFFVLPGHWSVLSRVLVCWNCGVAFFLALIFVWMARLTAEQICLRYTEEDESDAFQRGKRLLNRKQGHPCLPGYCAAGMSEFGVK